MDNSDNYYGDSPDAITKINFLGYKSWLLTKKGKGFGKPEVIYSQSSISIFLKDYYYTKKQEWERDKNNNRRNSYGYLHFDESSFAKNFILRPFDDRNLDPNKLLNTSKEEFKKLINELYQSSEFNYNRVNIPQNGPSALLRAVSWIFYGFL